MNSLRLLLLLLLPAVFFITAAAPDDSLLLPNEKHLRNLKQLTFGGENAEAYFSADATTTMTHCLNLSARVPAIAYCQGTPLRGEIEARHAGRLGEATDVAAEAVARRFGRDRPEGAMQAHVVTVER